MAFQPGRSTSYSACGIRSWNVSVEELPGLDLACVPSFSPVLDPVLIAARKAQEAVEADLSDC